MRSVMLVVLFSACSGVHTMAPDGGIATDAPADFCRELYGHQVNAGGRLGVDRADWPCPTWVRTEADRDLCVDFLRMDAALECEVESCEECAP